MAIVGFELIVDVDDAQTQLLFERLQAVLHPIAMGSWLKTDVMEILTERAAGRFLSSGDSASGRWALLSPKTVESRLGKGLPPGPPNIATSELMEFMINPGSNTLVSSDEGSILTYPGPMPDEIMVYKFGTAQGGNTRSGAPARRVAAVDSTDTEMIMTSLVYRLAQFISSGR